jgi:uncharacterized protein YbaP (TraB family)
MLRNAAKEPKRGIAFLKRMLAGWKERRADVIRDCVRERLTQTPTMFANLIEGRNRTWLPRLMALANDSVPTLVVAGVLHMVGPVGLPALLRYAGLEVVAVEVSGE